MNILLRKHQSNHTVVFPEEIRQNFFFHAKIFPTDLDFQ